jgi:light-regulated signal transduction histidine kinase (bacteriophytochrome)
MSMEAEMESRSSSGRPDPSMSELETFTYSVSHDLRSPMGAILNYAGVLAEDYHDALGPEGRDHLHRIAASAQKAIAMMDGLLAFSRVGGRELEITDIDVGTMVREIYAELCEARRDSDPELSMGGLPPARADRTLLRTLFTNLLSNAFKFTNGVEHPTVEVGGYAQGDRVVYYVKDNGAGFDMRYANKLFRMFEQLPTKEPHDGHGIGLAVVDRIVRRHGGSIRAEGVPGKGATFFVTLPDGTPPDAGQEPT